MTQILEVPFKDDVYEATFGAPVDVEYVLGPENETSFFDDTLSQNIVMDDTGKLAQFLLLHPWFVQHVVFVWKVRERTLNVMVSQFHSVMIEYKRVVVKRIKVRPVDNLTACHAIEEARETIEKYTGVNASDIRKQYESRDYFKSGLIPRLDI